MTFRIALTGDFQKDGKIIYPDFDLTQLKNTDGIEYDFYHEHKTEIEPKQLESFQGVIVLTPTVTSHSLSQSQNFFAGSRFGGGYDGVEFLLVLRQMLSFTQLLELLTTYGRSNNGMDDRFRTSYDYQDKLLQRFME